MKVIRAAIYLAAETATVWLLLQIPAIVFIWIISDFGAAFDTDWALLFWLSGLAYAAVTIPVAILAASVGIAFMRRGLVGTALHGIYAPWRPLAFLFWAKRTSTGSGRNFGDREEFVLTLPLETKHSASTFLDALGAYCARKGIMTDRTGYLRVIDGRTKWQLRRGNDDFSLEGWVEAPTAEDRDQICTALEQFASHPETMAA